MENINLINLKKYFEAGLKNINSYQNMLGLSCALLKFGLVRVGDEVKVGGGWVDGAWIKQN